MQVAGALVNLLLIAACCYAMYSLTPADNPYGYLAAAFSLVHGLLGLLLSFSEEPDECDRTFLISASILEVIPLPLANVEFYLVSDQSGVAMVHGLSLIPLFYDMIGKIGDEWDGSAKTLKDFALLGNIASTFYLAVKDGNHIYGGVAVTAIIARFGALLIDLFAEGFGPHVATVGNAGILALMTYALTQG
ncbi:uncharacterized protein LOC108095509 [Drosophila ficusphila]|uniref:uncharacterized protein LOC108095509 n=1 Tax=Drosophila ficusphila TaxID=30025 RepID=UPI0007E5E866|nr:uncharacterized protein LOC108095509 [Drosophila ficusphila]